MEAEAATEAVKKPAAAKIISKALTSSSWAFETAMLPLSMILVQVLTMVTLLICKLALNSGMRPFVFLVYRNLIAAAAVAPLALIFERCVRHFLLLRTCLNCSVSSPLLQCFLFQYCR
jgi:hypothetical protein